MFTNRFQTMIGMGDWKMTNKLISILHHDLLSNIDMSDESLESLFAKKGLSEEIEAELTLREILSRTKYNPQNLLESHRKGFSNAIYYHHPNVLKLYQNKKMCDFEFPQFKFAWEGKIEPFQQLVKLKNNPGMEEHVIKYITQQDCQKRTVIDYAMSGGNDALVALLLEEFDQYISFKELPHAALRTNNTHLAPIFMDKLFMRCKCSPVLSALIFEDYHYSHSLLEDAKKYSYDPIEAMSRLISAVSNIEQRKKWVAMLSSVAIIQGHAHILSKSLNDLPLEGNEIQRAEKIIRMLQLADQVYYEVNTLKSATLMFLPAFEKDHKLLSLVVNGLLTEINLGKENNIRIMAELQQVLPESLRKALIDPLKIKIERADIRSGMDIFLQMFELSKEKAPKEAFAPLLAEFKLLIETGEAIKDDYDYAVYLAFILGDIEFAKECYEASQLSEPFDGSIDSIFVYLNRYIFVLFSALQVSFECNFLEKMRNHLSDIVKTESSEFSLLFDAMIFAKGTKKDKSFREVYERIRNIPLVFNQSTIKDDEEYRYKFHTLAHVVFELITMLLPLNEKDEALLLSLEANNDKNVNLESLLIAYNNAVNIKRLVADLIFILNNYKPKNMGDEIQLSSSMKINPFKFKNELENDIVRLGCIYINYKKERSQYKAEANVEIKAATKTESKADIIARELLEEEQKEQAKQIARKQAKKSAKIAKQSRKKEEKEAAKEAARLEEIKQRQMEIADQEALCQTIKEDIEKLKVEQALLVKECEAIQSRLNGHYSNYSQLDGQGKQLSAVHATLFKQLTSAKEDKARLDLYHQVIQYGAPPSVAVLFQQFEGRIYLIGGAVRDLELKIRSPRDFDMVLFASVSEVKALYPKVEVKGEGEFSAVSIMIDGVKHDIALLRPEPEISHEMSLKRNSFKRDFTINAEYVAFTRMGIRRIDPWNASRHKVLREIEFVNVGHAHDVFILRPERYLRLIDICHYTQFAYSNAVKREVENVHANIPRFVEACINYSERVKRQYQKMLNQYGPSELLILLYKHQLFYPLLNANILSIADFASVLPLMNAGFFPRPVTPSISSSTSHPHIFKKE